MVEITGSLIPNFDVDVAVLRAGMEPEPTRGLMRSPTELMEGEPICSNACVCERQGMCVSVSVCVCGWEGWAIANWEGGDGGKGD